MNEPLREGSIRYWNDPTDEYIVAEPGSRLYSSVAIRATDVYRNGEWKDWNEEEDK